MTGSQLMKRIPRIKFPQRHPKPSSGLGSVPPPQASSPAGETPNYFFKSQVPANAGVGGKASVQPKRTPVTDKEIEAVMVNLLQKL
ncbi:hypothetical protein QJS04_geneDACA008189 [Acorus gramineus]|uniref:Uncharacterized protein n=1 Tax=Acorus gramineus TaxID=55184 RepID=A0AAV9AZC4_ACOGR|nr:hypothetical protein QJS04_geneDACA008189 [Acorus gramineus]